jgi:serine/threonine protein kinase
MQTTRPKEGIVSDVSTVTADRAAERAFDIPAPVDKEEAVARTAVASSLVSPEEAHAALVVSQVTGAPVAEVLSANDVLPAETAKSLDEEVSEHLIPGYRILETIGRGGQGVVYRALQKCLDRVVALKVVSLRATPSSSTHLRLDREAHAIARLNHPNIVAAYDYGESRGRLYLAMEYIEGSSCEREMAGRRDPLRKERALGIVRDVAAGLECAREAGIIHRDVKPANILLPAPRSGSITSGSSIQAKVADLGLSRMGVSDLTIEGAILGTPGYIAPEQVRGNEVDHRADIYSLGATLYHLVTGHRPFAAREPMTVFVRQLTEQLANPRDLNPDVPQGMVYLLQGMLSRNPATRYASYPDLVADIDRVACGEKPVFPVPPGRDRSVAGPSGDVPVESPVCMDMISRVLLLDHTPEGFRRALGDAQRREAAAAAAGPA